MHMHKYLCVYLLAKAFQMSWQRLWEGKCQKSMPTLRTGRLKGSEGSRDNRGVMSRATGDSGKRSCIWEESGKRI